MQNENIQWNYESSAGSLIQQNYTETFKVDIKEWISGRIWRKQWNLLKSDSPK